MKRLILLRHGKSDWSASYGPDHDRPLAPRGRRAARLMGQFLASIAQTPDLIISSSATRAESTATLAAAAGGLTARVQIEPRFYGNSASGVLSILQKQDDEYQSILIVGHEPTWSDLASGLVGGGYLRVVTAALVIIEIAANRWSDVAMGQGELRMLLPPKWLAKGMAAAEKTSG